MLVPWIDPDQVCRGTPVHVASEDVFTDAPNCGHCLASTRLYDRQRLSIDRAKPVSESLFLLLGAVTDPVIVAEHENVWPDDLVAAGALRNRLGLKAVRADVDGVELSIKYLPARAALEMHDAPVALDYLFRLEASFAEVIVDVAGEHKVVPFHQILT